MIFFDLHLPKTSGFKVLEEIKQKCMMRLLELTMILLPISSVSAQQPKIDITVLMRDGKHFQTSSDVYTTDRQPPNLREEKSATVADASIHIRPKQRYLIFTEIVGVLTIEGPPRSYTEFVYTDLANVSGIKVELNQAQYTLFNDTLADRSNISPTTLVLDPHGRSYLSLMPARPSLSSGCKPDRQQEFFPADWPKWADRQPIPKFASCQLSDIVFWMSFEQASDEYSVAWRAANLTGWGTNSTTNSSTNSPCQDQSVTVPNFYSTPNGPMISGVTYTAPCH